MLGRTHAASAAVAALAVAALVDLPVLAVPAMASVACLSGFAPDIDHPAARAAKVLPPVSWGACWAVRNLSVRLGMPAHRGLSHSVPFAIFWGLFVGGLSALVLTPAAAVWVGLFAFVGCLFGMLGDVPTKQSLQYLLWPTHVQVRWPKWLRFRTGRTVEKLIFRGLFVAGAVLLPVVLR